MFMKTFFQVWLVLNVSQLFNTRLYFVIVLT